MPKINSVSENGINFIIRWECGASMPVPTRAYQDMGGVWTIGVGNTQYLDGRLVKEGDIITKSEAITLFSSVLRKFAQSVSNMITSNINQNQFDSLVSLAYNIGTTAFCGSALLKKVNKNPEDKNIVDEFMRWNKVKGVVVGGLSNRRKAEATLYFSKMSPTGFRRLFFGFVNKIRHFFF